MSRRLKPMANLNAQLNAQLDSPPPLEPIVVFPDGSATWFPPPSLHPEGVSLEYPEAREFPGALESLDTLDPLNPLGENSPESTDLESCGSPVCDRPTSKAFWVMSSSIALLLGLTYFLTQVPATPTSCPSGFLLTTLGGLDRVEMDAD